MKAKIKNWLAPPVFEGDEERTWRASLINGSIIVGMFMYTLVIIGTLIGGRTPITVLVIDVIMLITLFIMHRLLLNGKVVLAGIGIIITLFLTITGSAVAMGTIRTPATAGCILLVIVAGFLFSYKGIILSTVSSSLLVLGLILAENAGVLPDADFTVTITQWVTYTVLFGFTGFLAYFSYQSNIQALKRITKESAERKRAEEEQRKLIVELKKALSDVKTLSGLLPICSSCKKIRDDKGYWNQIERYIEERSEADFTHGICPDCAKEFYSNYHKNKD